jgi:predicted RNA binding protein YcfA (HicA-like mRNA interferase family)
MCRILEKQGWALVRVRGSHHAYQMAGHLATIIVSVHGSDDLKLGTKEGVMAPQQLAESCMGC